MGDKMRYQVVCNARGCYLSDLGAFYDDPSPAETLAWAHEQRYPRDSRDPADFQHFVVVKDLKAGHASTEPATATGKKEAAHG